MRTAFVLAGLAVVALNAPAFAQPAPAKKAEGAQTAVCLDVADSWPLRSKITAEHLKYIDTIKDRIKIAGPIRGPKGLPHGAILVYATENLEDAKKMLADDPFSKNKLFATCDWYDFSQYVGSYVGGWAGPFQK